MPIVNIQSLAVPKGTILPYLNIPFSINFNGGTNLGCHIGTFAGLQLPVGQPDNLVWLTKLKDEKNEILQWGPASTELRVYAGKEMLALDAELGLKEFIFSDIVRQYNMESDVHGYVKQFYLASDNVDNVSYGYNGSWWATREFVEYLVEQRGWGVLASHIGRNPNHKAPIHNVQIWVLTPPCRLKYLYPNTNFRKNLTSEKIGGPELFKFTSGDKIGFSSDFMDGRDYTFKKYIQPRIMRLEKVRELFKEKKV